MTVEDLCGHEDGCYVGLNADGDIVVISSDLSTVQATQEKDDHIVSVGFLSFTITDYDETYSVGAGLLTEEEDPDMQGPSPDSDPDEFLAYWHSGAAEGHWSSPHGCHSQCPVCSGETWEPEEEEPV